MGICHTGKHPAGNAPPLAGYYRKGTGLPDTLAHPGKNEGNHIAALPGNGGRLFDPLWAEE